MKQTNIKDIAQDSHIRQPLVTCSLSCVKNDNLKFVTTNKPHRPFNSRS